MKKKMLVLSTALLMAFGVTFAKDIKPVPESIVKKLTREFKNASNVHWKTTDNFYKATFVADEESYDAFYSFDGQLIALSRPITANQLPMGLGKEVKEKSATHSVSDLFEIWSERGTEYYVTFHNEKGAKTYKSEGTSWVLY